MIVTQSETSDEAVQKFDHSMESLRKLDVAQNYMELLTEVESLRSVYNFEALNKYFLTNAVSTARKLVATSKCLLKMLYYHTSDYKTSSML